MRQTLMASLLLTALLFLVPLFLFSTAAAPAPQDTPTPTPASAGQTAALQDDAVTLQVWNGKKTVSMTMTEYLKGVVRGEMPASFAEEALKAQAAAERTYIYYQMKGGRKAAHPDADICTDHTCCNAWLSQKDAAAKWGDKADAYEAKIRQAVEATDGQVVLYQGAPILAAFHSSSAGVTAKSGDVWTSDLPYLASVKSPEGEDSVPNYYSVKTLSASEFCDTFRKAYPQADFPDDPSRWVQNLTHNSSDRVESVTIGGVSVSGTEVRSVFGLRSACFTVDVGADGVTFHVTGYGHGVGMSQYGANELAHEGKTWREILAWYYTDTTIGTYSP